MTAVAKWEVFEVRLSTTAEYANPFLDMSVDAVFSREGQSHRVDGFYDGMEDGAHVWCVRFAPMCEGDWTFDTRSGDPALVTSGDFTCTPAVSAGSLRISRSFANWFEREDGSHTFIASDGWLPHVRNEAPGVRDFEDLDFQQPTEQEWNLYVDVLADHGVNAILDMGQLYARQSTITDTSFRWPWKVVDPAANRIDRDRFNLEYYQRMDRQVRHMRERDIFFAMELLYDNSVVRPREWSNHPSNVANGGWLEGNDRGVGWNAWFDMDNPVHMEYVRRYVEYTWARYGAFWNVMWEVGGENGNLARISDERLPQAFIDPQIPAAWYSYWGDFLSRRDPYSRLKSFGDAGRQEVMVTTAHNNFIITQDPRNYAADDVKEWCRAMNGLGENMWKFGRPVFIGEMTAGNNGQYDGERRLYWVALVSGYTMGRADRHYPMVIDGIFGETVKFGLPGVPPIYDDILRMREFIESRGIRFWRMRPSDRLLQADTDLVYCLAAQDEEYIVYFAFGGSATLTVPTGTAEWFDPRTGASGGIEAIEAGERRFTAPDHEDWVLHIRAAGV